MAHPHQPDHESELLGELLSWLRAKPKIRALGEGLSAQLQVLEEDFRELREERLLSTAIGAQLDQYGLLVGEQRGSLSDADFLRFVEARILTNTSEGDADRFMEILRIIAGPLTAGTDVEYTPIYPAGIMATVTRDAPLSATMAARVAAQMTSVAPAGVEVVLIEADGTAPGPFRYDIGPGYDVGKYAWLIP